MGARDRQQPALRAELGQQLAAVDHASDRAPGPDQLRVVVRNRGRDDHLRVGGHVLGVVAELRVDPGRAEPLQVGGLGPVGAGHLGAERLATSARPLIPAPPIAMKWSRRPLIALIPSDRLQDLVGDPLGGIGLRQRRAAIGHRAEAVLVGEQLGDRRAEPLRAVSSLSGITTAAPPSAIQRALVV